MPQPEPRYGMDAVEAQPEDTAGCDCIHAQLAHCPVSHACLVVNPTFGPCPCLATIPTVREALEAAWHYGRSGGMSYRKPIRAAI
jgi:hypothetical protein